jgi:hypothetical protein
MLKLSYQSIESGVAHAVTKAFAKAAAPRHLTQVKPSQKQKTTQNKANGVKLCDTLEGGTEDMAN